MHAEYCQDCGRERQRWEFLCPATITLNGRRVPCRCDTYVPTIPEGCSPVIEEVPVSGPLQGQISLPWGRVALLYGGPGAGKTTIALKTLPGATILSSEMDPALVAAYCERLGVKRGAIHRPCVAEDGSIDLGIPDGERPRELVFDSLAETAPGTAPLDALMQWCEVNHARAVAITQVNSEGQPRGGPQMVHKPHQRIRVGVDAMGNSTLTVEKNRGGELCSVVFDLKTGDRNTINVYCSVEGTFPNYLLAPHPDSKARRADVLWAAEKGELELPPYPVAVGAKRSRLYPSGWVELPGLEQRRAFAASRGIEYFSPVDLG